MPGGHPLNGGPQNFAFVAGLYEAGPRSQTSATEEKTSCRCAIVIIVAIQQATQSRPGYPDFVADICDSMPSPDKIPKTYWLEPVPPKIKFILPVAPGEIHEQNTANASRMSRFIAASFPNWMTRL